MLSSVVIWAYNVSYCIGWDYTICRIGIAICDCA